MKRLILKFAPIWLQNLAISLYNFYQYRQRHSGIYNERRRYFEAVDKFAPDELRRAQSARLEQFLLWVTNHSEWYKKNQSCSDLAQFPVLEKSDVLQNLNLLSTIREADSIVSLTGGTTGASMKVLYTKNDIQERHALLDHFRAGYGYELGKKVAWFSGKSLARERDLLKGICYRDDKINKIRFFSTFHISNKYFESYWAALTAFSPEFIVGFPSSVFDICVMAKQRGLRYPGKVKIFFPTAETVLLQHREIISEVLGCRLVDQYASSEGAPFILECHAGSKHIHPLSGVFEVVDENMEPACEGEMLVTSFTTHGTPLVRYRIGDRMKLAPLGFNCSCGSAFPVVEYIDGRTSDYILSPENGKVNLGNISNCTKDVVGINCFQVEQKTVDKITVRIVPGTGFDRLQQNRFVDALVERVGASLTIEVECVPDIPRESSGKFRIVKNHLDCSIGNGS